ncbi:hypothetical protein HOY34_18230 [Xinfangfangia sp. D13-10-4-6]|uniref:hypothetical protein n=1 Tax=Pseudogemmobacter hezensis TaxID=2737662 RepID=UPI0015577326|nr:hypothetical protein [Pseudogemmobacter hezensis]NPD17135.1 hypothetical protein [Pseudogemmobacter hezensis]
MSAVTIRQMAGRVEELLAERLGARGADFEAKLRHRGRRLPRKVRRAAADLAQASAMTHNPRLHAQLDEGIIARDYDICLRYFSTLARGSRGRGARGPGLVSLGLSLLVVAAAAVGFMLWRGLI